MLSLLITTAVLISKLLLYLALLCIIILIVLKLWLEPVKRVCNCKTKLHDRVAVVTGGNSGIGYETALNLAKRGATVIIASRNEKKSDEAVARIIKATGNINVTYKPLDLSKFSSVKEFADDLNRTIDRLDILVNNAGVAGMKEKLTQDGLDITMQVNYFSAFLLTNLLLAKIKASKPSRIVNVTSYGHVFHKLNVDDLAGVESVGQYAKYANSKLCQVLWTKALAKRLPQGVTVNCLHPGVVSTDIFHRIPEKMRNILLCLIEFMFKTPKEGSQTCVHLCVAPELVNATGGYYSECLPSAVAKIAKDDNVVETVWNESLRLTQCA